MEAGVEVVIRMGRTLYDPNELVRRNGNKPTMSISQVQKAAAMLGEPVKLAPAPMSLPDPGDVNLSSIDHNIPAQEPDFNTAHRTAGKENQYVSIMGPNKDFAVPHPCGNGNVSGNHPDPRRRDPRIIQTR